MGPALSCVKGEAGGGEVVRRGGAPPVPAALCRPTRPMPGSADFKKIARLIRSGRLAPCYPPDDGDADDALAGDVCPICFTRLPAVNRTICCGADLCTECFIQMQCSTVPPGKAPCCYCKAAALVIKFFGPRTLEERRREASEEAAAEGARRRALLQQQADCAGAEPWGAAAVAGASALPPPVAAPAAGSAGHQPNAASVGSDSAPEAASPSRGPRAAMLQRQDSGPSTPLAADVASSRRKQARATAEVDEEAARLEAELLAARFVPGCSLADLRRGLSFSRINRVMLDQALSASLSDAPWQKPPLASPPAQQQQQQQLALSGGAPGSGGRVSLGPGGCASPEQRTEDLERSRSGGEGGAGADRHEVI